VKVTVFGVGHVGRVQAAVLADVGNNVICIDVDAVKVERLKQGKITIFEPDPEGLVKRNCDDGRLHFTTDAAMGVANADVIFIAVGTPPDEDGSADLKYVLAVAETIGRHMDAPRIIATKSTVPVGTADKVREAVTAALKQPVELPSSPIRNS
jgi:UDPglucose 6-dehydrogenase